MESAFYTKWIYFLISGFTGYLLGSISFAHIITRIVTKSKKVNEISRDIAETDITFHSDSVAATAVSLNLGRKFGCLTSILDMLKVTIPTLVFHILFPNTSYYLVAALCGMIGHIYPVYHRFKGGRGQSPLMGALLVINWFSIPLSALIGAILGYLFGAVLFMRWGWMVVVVFWFAIYFKDPWHVGFILLSNVLFWYSMKPEIIQFLEIKRRKATTQEEISDFLFMGKRFGRFIDNYGLPALIKKLRTRS